MTSKIKVDNITDQGGNELIKRCGSTTTVGSGSGNTINVCGSAITLGRSGGTVSLASGATQSGFGRTGTVDWQTGSIKTGDFTATSGEGYFVNTTSGTVAVTLPGSPSAGDIVAVADYAGTSATNAISINRNGSNFEGSTLNGAIATNRQTATLVYVDGTQGWVVVNSNDTSFLEASFVAATGGTVTTCGDFKIHTFTGPGTFCVSAAGNVVGSNTISYMVVAGGGGSGGSESGAWGGAGGGGAGGFRESKASYDTYTASPLNATSGPTYNLPVSVQGYPITVGAGGAGGPGPNGPTNGSGAKVSDSVFSTITSAGGGGGGSSTPGKGPCAQRDGGSGGGGKAGTPQPPGSGNTPPVSPAQGFDGGTGLGTGNAYALGGGGGATATGVTPPGPNNGSNGGAGATTNIPGSPISKSGGGGSGAALGNPGGTGGVGGGANGGSGPSPGPSASANTGGGAGGAAGSNTSPLSGGTGGSGIVVIRYKYQ